MPTTFTLFVATADRALYGGVLSAGLVRVNYGEHLDQRVDRSVLGHFHGVEVVGESGPDFGSYGRRVPHEDGDRHVGVERRLAQVVRLYHYLIRNITYKQWW